MPGLPQSGVALVAEGADRYFGDMRTAAQSTNAFSDTVDRASGRVSSAGQVMIGALREFGAITANVFAEAGKAAIGFVGDSIKVAGNFESGMNRFQSAAGDALTASGADLEDFRDLFIDIGKELPVSTAEVQDAAIELVKGGLDPLILKAGGLKDAINFAAAAELGLADAAVVSVKQLGVWTEATATAEEQTRFLAMSQDLMVRAAGASTVNVDSLARAMNNAGGQARALNLDYKDFVTGVTLIAPAFSSAEQAGTGFNVFLKQLQPSTKPATEAFAELNLLTEEGNSVFFDAQGRFIGVAAAAEVLKDATTGLTDAKKAELLQTIFGIDGMVAANTLIQAGAEGYDILAQKIDQASGVQAAAAAKQAGYNTAMDNFKGSIEALQITGGTILLPFLTDLLNNVLAPGVNTVTNFVDALSKGATPAQALRDALKPVVDSVNSVLPGFAAFTHLLKTGSASAGGWARISGMFTSLFGPAIGGVFSSATRDIMGFAADVRTTIETLKPVFGTFGILLREGEVSVGGWARVGNILRSVFGADLGSVLQESIGLVGKVVQEFRSAESISELFQRIAADLGHWGDSVVPIVQSSLSRMRDAFIGWVSDSLPSWKAQLGSFAAAAGEWVMSAIPELLDNLADMRERLFSWVTDSLPGWLTEVGRFAEPAAEWILDAIPPLLDNVGTFIKRVTDQTFTYLPQWGATLVEFGVKAISWIGDALPGLADNLGRFLNGMSVWVVDSLPKWGAQLAEFGGKAVGWVLDALPGLGANLGSMTGKILGWVVETAIDVVPKLADLGLKFVTWVATDVLPELPGALLNIATGIYNFIAELLAEVSPKIMEVSAKFTDWVQEDVLPRLPGVLNDIKTGITTWIRDTTIWVGTELTAIGKGLVDGIKKGIQDNWNSFKNWMLGMLEGFKDTILSFFGIQSPSYVMAVEVGEPIVLGMLEGMQNTFPELMNYVTTMTDEIRQQFEDTADAITDTMISIQRSTAGGYRTQAANMAKLADFSDTSDLERDIKETEEARYNIFLKLQDEIARGNDANQTTIEQYKEQIALLEERKTALAQTAKDQEFVASELGNRLNVAFAEAQAKFTDPRDVMRYYDLLSEQAFEFADLQQQYYDAVAKGDTERMVRLSDQMLLIDRAQALEREAFTAEANKTNELLELQQQIEGLKEHATIIGDATEGILTFFETLADVMNYALGDIPGYAKGGFAQGGKMITVGERGRELFVPQTDGWVIPNTLTDGLLSAFSGRTSPAAGASQIMTSSTNNYTYGGPTYNLGVTTNQSPAVAQQSFWMMQSLAQ